MRKPTRWTQGPAPSARAEQTYESELTNNYQNWGYETGVFWGEHLSHTPPRAVKRKHLAATYD